MSHVPRLTCLRQTALTLPTHALPPLTRRYVYPAKRSEKDGEGRARGQPGRLELLNARIVSSQPLVAWDWCGAKEGLAAAACLDQTVRVYLVTKLERHR